jgi:hypothetical protein
MSESNKSYFEDERQPVRKHAIMQLCNHTVIRSSTQLFVILLILCTVFLVSCRIPNTPESVLGGDGGYKIVNKLVTSGYAQDVVVKGSMAYIAQGQGNLMIVNISNPKEPKIVSELSYGLKGYSYKIINKDSVIFLANGDFGVSIVNAADPKNPQATDTNLPIKPAKNFCFMGDFLFTATSETGIDIHKISDGVHLEGRSQFSSPGYALGVCVTADSNYLLVACGELGFTIFDISEFGDGWNYPPYREICRLKIPGYAEDIFIHPDLPVAFIACGTGGLVIVDYSDTANVKIIGSYDTGGYAKEVAYKNNKVFVTTELRGLQVFDVTNLNSPVRLGTVQTQYALGVAVDDNYIYVADQQEGLVVISKP